MRKANAWGLLFLYRVIEIEKCSSLSQTADQIQRALSAADWLSGPVSTLLMEINLLFMIVFWDVCDVCMVEFVLTCSKNRCKKLFIKKI